MYTFISIVYVFVCLFLILVVLLQSGKGGGLGSAFGGGGTGQQIFGGAGAGNLLTRLTAVFAFTFMALSVWLAFLSSSGEQALDRAVRDQTAAQEAAAETEAEEAEAARRPKLRHLKASSALAAKGGRPFEPIAALVGPVGLPK
jgi:preprotein translocase subunit SecG